MSKIANPRKSATTHPASGSNRRGFLMNTVVGAASLASTAAVARPSIAANLSPGSSSPDLSARLEAVRERWRVRHLADRESAAILEARLTAATGLPSDQYPRWDDHSPEAKRYRALRLAAARELDDPDTEPCDEHGCSIEWNSIHDEMFSVCLEILKRPALSVADIVLQAQAYALLYSEEWTSEPTNHGEARMLIESICRFAGVEALTGVEAVPMPTNDEGGEG